MSSALLWQQVGQLLVFVPLLLYLSPTMAFGKFYCPGWLFYLVHRRSSELGIWLMVEWPKSAEVDTHEVRFWTSEEGLQHIAD